MNTPPPPSYPTIDALVSQATNHVQKIFGGNGVKKDSILLTSHNLSILTIHAGTYLELKPIMQERQIPGKITVGQMVASREAATKAVNQTMVEAAMSPTTKAQITAILLDRADKGFGLKQQIIPIPFLKKEFTWHEPCHVCNGSTRATCPKCMGRKKETCVKCTGRGLMKCPMCLGTGLLQGNKCNKCHAQRYVPCDGCQRSGFMNCRTCNGIGAAKCVTCHGVGFKSNVLTLNAEAMTYFEYDPKSMPKNAADMIELHGAELAAKNVIKIKGRMADDKENALGASYEVEFPCGELVFKIGDIEAKAQLFGYNHTLSGMPNLLDKMLGASVRELEDAAHDLGSVAEKIKNATRYKIMAQAFLMTQKSSPKKVYAQLLKLYDVGLSTAMAEKIAILTHTTTSKITKKPRYIGLGWGILGTIIFATLYYLLPIRSFLGVYFPASPADIILDFLPILLGGVITTFSIQRTGAKSVQTALGHLVKEEAKQKLVAKAESLGVLGYILAGFVCLVVLEMSILMGTTPPFWIQSIKSLF